MHLRKDEATSIVKTKASVHFDPLVDSAGHLPGWAGLQLKPVNGGVGAGSSPWRRQVVRENIAHIAVLQQQARNVARGRTAGRSEAGVVTRNLDNISAMSSDVLDAGRQKHVGMRNYTDEVCSKMADAGVLVRDHAGPANNSRQAPVDGEGETDAPVQEAAEMPKPRAVPTSAESGG